MLEVKNIKLRKDRVDEYRVRHWFDAGTNHLPAVYAVKHHYYDIYDAEGNRYNWDKYGGMRTLKAVKEWIAAYDAIEDARIAAKKAKEEREESERKARRDSELNSTEVWKMSVRNPLDVDVDSMVDVKVPHLNKNETIGEFAVQLNSSSDYSKHRGKVVAKIELTNEEYDKFIVSLMDNSDLYLRNDPRPAPMEGWNTVGGAQSDDPRLDTVEELWNMTDELSKIWFDTSYLLLHAVTAPNRQTFFVDTSGYNYARYVAFAA